MWFMLCISVFLGVLCGCSRMVVSVGDRVSELKVEIIVEMVIVMVNCL